MKVFATGLVAAAMAAPEAPQQATPLSIGSPAIIGGKNASDGQFPWQVTLARASGSHYCGGSILAPTKVRKTSAQPWSSLSWISYPISISNFRSCAQLTASKAPIIGQLELVLPPEVANDKPKVADLKLLIQVTTPEQSITITWFWPSAAVSATTTTSSQLVLSVHQMPVKIPELVPLPDMVTLK